MPQKGTITGWNQKLDGGRLEIFLKVEGVEGTPDAKIRASGPPEYMNRLADDFEAFTGVSVNAEWRVRAVKQLPGQTTLDIGDVVLAPESEDPDADV